MSMGSDFVVQYCCNHGGTAFSRLLKIYSHTYILHVAIPITRVWQINATEL